MHKVIKIVFVLLTLCSVPVMAQDDKVAPVPAVVDTAMIDSTSLLLDEAALELEDSVGVAESGGAYTQLKKKFCVSS